jgi:predicted RNA binding protein YcfA (HicA-like mRNA interferase family)
VRIPTDLSGQQLVKALSKLGYDLTRQKGSHIRLSAELPEGQHHITVPNHSPIRVGTLKAILDEIASRFGISRDALLEKLF